MSISITVPNTAGTYFYGACVDPVAGEVRTANNCSSAVRVIVITGIPLSPSDFNTLSSAGNHFPYGIWSDGTTMWVADDENDKIYAYWLSNKARNPNEEFDTLSGAGNNLPGGLWSDSIIM